MGAAVARRFCGLGPVVLADLRAEDEILDDPPS
jgi:hypothetical protein